MYTRAVLKGGKAVPKLQFRKKTACSSYVQPWLVAIGGWRVVVPGGSPQGRSLAKRKKLGSLRTTLVYTGCWVCARMSFAQVWPIRGQANAGRYRPDTTFFVAATIHHCSKHSFLPALFVPLQFSSFQHSTVGQDLRK